VIREKQDDMSLPHTFHCILFFIQSKILSAPAFPLID